MIYNFLFMLVVTSTGYSYNQGTVTVLATFQDREACLDAAKQVHSAITYAQCIRLDGTKGVKVP